VNPHERSSLDVGVDRRAHVKTHQDAREARLPEQIIDISRSITDAADDLLLREGAEASASSGTAVNDDDFRYPGRSPDKEAAIFMLATRRAARGRSRSDPPPARDVTRSGTDVLDGSWTLAI